MAEDQAPKSRVPLGVKVLLFASLAVNLVIAGVVAGAVWSGGPPGGRVADRQGATPFTMALGKEDRRAVGLEIRQTFRGMKREDRPREIRRAAHAEALEILRAETFDEVGFVAVMARQTDVMQLMARTGAEALARHIASLSDAERGAYADRVEEALKRRSKRPEGGPKPLRD